MTEPPGLSIIPVYHVSTMCLPSRLKRGDGRHSFMSNGRYINADFPKVVDGRHHGRQTRFKDFRDLGPFVYCLLSISKEKKKVGMQPHQGNARDTVRRWTLSAKVFRQPRMNQHNGQRIGDG